MTLNHPNLSFLRNAVEQQCSFKVGNVFFGPPGILLPYSLFIVKCVTCYVTTLHLPRLGLVQSVFVPHLADNKSMFYPCPFYANSVCGRRLWRPCAGGGWGWRGPGDGQVHRGRDRRLPAADPASSACFATDHMAITAATGAGSRSTGWGEMSER